ncbi:MAG: ribonucleoside-diphosphate reductase subunit alpha [Spirochaetaceae bacterium]|nr:ribonucleoside-diphosphate reductase subunit alpha [Spirochaetaceae bacterium]
MSQMVIKRTGEVVDFDGGRIRVAISKAIRATAPPDQWDSLENGTLSAVVAAVVGEIDTRFTDLYPNVENIQDIVEKHLVKNGLYEIAKAYILYRAERQQAREQHKDQVAEQSLLGKLTVRARDGRMLLFDIARLTRTIRAAAQGTAGVGGAALDAAIAVDEVARETIRNIYDGISSAEVEKALLLASASFIERDPSYSRLAARLFLRRIYKEVIGSPLAAENLDTDYRDAFRDGIRRGVEAGTFDGRLLDYDFERLAGALRPERDDLFLYMGVQTLYERYFTRVEGAVIETPQAFWMRVAMGIALPEQDREAQAIRFYELISSLRFVPSTPTLFHAGTNHPQLSSCYLTTVGDDLGSIFKAFSDNAQLSKWSGGLGNDWSNIRATGAAIRSTGVESQGVVPFLKIASDVTLAINRSGKRRGATCAYLETWHLDIEDFLDLRRNTGDERRRTHDMNTANWIPDLFMKRVLADREWTLFSPDETPDLHSLYGRRFEQRYLHYEELARAGKLRRHRTLPAVKLWRKMLSMLFETGHPWITFKDPCNIRSPQDHAGVVNSSNLCTEITLNTSATETAVCNLGSVNLEKHVTSGGVDEALLADTVTVAMRMLDNVIDINFYPTEEAKNSNLRHRPVGLGLMGLQDALFKLDLAHEDPATMTVVDRMMESISYHAILGSSRLAAERGTYASYRGSKWDRGVLPHDTLALLEEERGMALAVDAGGALDWTPVREHVARHGMRNSNTMAIAPTATISNIAGCFPSFEPPYKNIYVKSNISGEFTVINPYLVEDLRAAGHWNRETADQLKFHDGSLQEMRDLSPHLRRKYKVAFEIDPLWYLRLAAVRGKWLDQSQSLNVFMQGTSGRLLSDIYQFAWKLGLKTTYYLRAMAATQVEKATLGSAYGNTQRRATATATATAAANGAAGSRAGAPAVPAAANGMATAAAPAMDAASAAGSPANQAPAARDDTPAPAPACLLDDESCEVCQ